MITQGSIISGTAVIGTTPEEIVPFTDSFITDRALIWEKMVAIFQVSNAWTCWILLNPLALGWSLFPLTVDY